MLKLKEVTPIEEVASFNNIQDIPKELPIDFLFECVKKSLLKQLFYDNGRAESFSMSVQPLVYIYRTILRMSRPGGFPTGLNGLGFSYIGSRPSYMRLSSPYTWPQFRIGIVHFFVASNVDKYRAFKRAVSLGNTLL